MKRIVLTFLLLALGSSGCFPMDFMRPAPMPAPVPVVEQAPPIVTEDQVNERNAGDCAKALRTDIEYEKLRRVGNQPRE